MKNRSRGLIVYSFCVIGHNFYGSPSERLRVILERTNNFVIEMKYTCIPADELEKLEEEFVNFLVVNGITADDWLTIKENEPLNADEIINQFSDVVWESILRGTRYLNKLEELSAYYFKADSDEIFLIKIDKNESGSEMLKTSKKYNKVREVELFEMIQSGCTISDGKDYEHLI